MLAMYITPVSDGKSMFVQLETIIPTGDITCHSALNFIAPDLYVHQLRLTEESKPTDHIILLSGKVHFQLSTRTTVTSGTPKPKRNSQIPFSNITAVNLVWISGC